jgi:serine/threonine-protein kinase ULK/ATG1
MKEFMAETQMLSSLNHPNVIRLLGVWKDEEGANYMVVEFAEGGSLDTYLQEHFGEINDTEFLRV